MFGLNFYYIRNCVLVLAAQALILMLTANLFLVPRFHLEHFFTFGEMFMYCTCIMVLFHNLRISQLHDHVLYLTNLMQSFSAANIHLLTVIAQKIVDDPEKIKSILQEPDKTNSTDQQ